VPGEFTHPEVSEAIESVRAAFAAVGKSCGYFGIEAADVKASIASGFNLVACGLAVLLLRTGATALATHLRASDPPSPV